VSRLDSFIRRLEAQRACLDRAAALIAALAGPVLEFGLGNGRTYDHLRTILPGRDIFVFERAVAAHPDCVPPADRLILGDVRDTLPASRDRFAGGAALAHIDIGTGETEASRAFAASVAQLIAPLLRPGAVVVSEPPLVLAGWRALELPAEVRPGRYHLYRVGD
jgi:S-adenosyl-L-methionine methyltransferase